MHTYTYIIFYERYERRDVSKKQFRIIFFLILNYSSGFWINAPDVNYDKAFIRLRENLKR